MTEMGNSPNGLSSRLDQAEEKFSDLEDRTTDAQTAEQEIKKEENRRELGGPLDYHQVGQCKHESPCREAKGTKILCEEIMDENL